MVSNIRQKDGQKVIKEKMKYDGNGNEEKKNGNERFKFILE